MQFNSLKIWPWNKAPFFSILEFLLFIFSEYYNNISDFQKYHYNVYGTKSVNLNRQMRNSRTLYLHHFYNN